MKENTAPLNSPLSSADATELIWQIKQQINQVFIGQNPIVEQILCAVLAGGHALLEGVPGLGKTLLVKALAKSCNCQFARIQFTPDLMPADVTGHMLYDMKASEFIVRKGPIFANFILADEINRAPAKTQAALLEVMQEGQITIEGETTKLDPPFLVMATQNPIEHDGTYSLPEAQLDRFLLHILITYPNAEDERTLVMNNTTVHTGNLLSVESVKSLANPEIINALQQITAQVHVDESILDYALRIVRSTRKWPGISIGAGPRGTIALIRIAKACAILDGRDFVIPDDIKRQAISTLRHRIILSPEAEIEGISKDFLLAKLISQVEVPRQ